ncbi:sigma-70 family RNA polymerase sigma factor [Vibrio sp. THAF190c]|jgi:RNA polymerase sigma factor (sigma-70 family)|uniref:sigma-70 family RNA polymerase sigma factor n=1 Tax=Vibrio sp. THAF190c TaxID=2587865 RepID=UPI0012685A45|nr:sigma-70 family RNA polymerase sigma factor [Vibrio sp. THAF190c]QFT13285.1 RNA polymerase sigma factor RpoS [Vibrio sp. THAF190c]
MQPIEIYYKELEEKEILSREEEESLYPLLAIDPNARKRLVEANLKIALKSARSFQRKNPKYELIELISEANLGLAVAIERFEPSKGFRFSTYAQCWINNRLNQYDLFNHSAVPAPKRAYYKSKKISFLKGKDTPLKEILDEVGCTQDDMEQIEQISSRSYVPIDEFHEETISDPNDTSLESVDEQDLLSKVEQLINDSNVLKDKERLCLTALYGFGSQEKQSQASLAAKLNQSTEEIRTIQRNALKQLQTILA